MKTFVCLQLLLVVALIAQNDGQGTEVIERSLQLSSTLEVSWTIDFAQQSATFTVTGETLGFIGFGISPQGGMNGADVIIGGVSNNGEPYFTDRFASKEAEPKIDDHQDWFLIEASENATHTVLHFNRTLDTCDIEDLAITNDTTKFIWSLGTSDAIIYHEQRGAASVNILDPPMPAYDTSKFEIWDAIVNTTIPTTDTTYWCTLHKSPKFSSKRQIVGFDVLMDAPDSIKHNHHLTIYMCRNEPGSEMNEILENYLNHPGGLCFDPDDSNIKQLAPFCQSIMYVWAKGGAPVFLPDNVGFPLNEDGGEEFFYLEIHYDNPQVLAGVQYETGVRMYMTDELREQDAGLMVVGYDISITQTIPPNSKDFIQSTHCSSRCTATEIPETGLEIFNVLHHAHLSGRKLKFRQFRPQEDGNFVELPWISYDDRYDFDFQQSRPLKEPAKLMPGDHLTVECTFDTTWKQPPSSTYGGFSTREEMCEAIFMYYPKIPLFYCSSFHPLDALLDILGIDQLDQESNPKDPTVLLPEQYAGRNYSTVLDTMIDWTDELRNELQMKVRYNDHLEECHLTSEEVGRGQTRDDFYWTSYPKDFVEYVPPKGNCGK